MKVSGRYYRTYKTDEVHLNFIRLRDQRAFLIKHFSDTALRVHLSIDVIFFCSAKSEMRIHIKTRDTNFDEISQELY